ncbi:hypothetical protein AMECASPLE_017720 [Ameca splendens]|uniref:Uncharacterized protein n=1 Tax=Ameca splendens TaxID=208324 RepID=A0ABV0ZDN7_9TELE
MSVTPDTPASSQGSPPPHTHTHIAFQSAILGSELELDRALVMKSLGPPQSAAVGGGCSRGGSPRGIAVYPFHNGLENVFLLHSNDISIEYFHLTAKLHLAISETETGRKGMVAGHKTRVKEGRKDRWISGWMDRKIDGYNV